MGNLSERKCPKCFLKGIVAYLKVQRWGAPDYKWDCLVDGCNYSKIGPWAPPPDLPPGLSDLGEQEGA